jgi:tRNA(Ile)-lysidine synthase TilS/MesJ
MLTLAERFRAHLVRRRLFPGPGTALVAVSGGPDSVALLDLLVSHSPAGPRLVVGHVDHGIRRERQGGRSGAAAAAHARVIESARLELGPGTTETAARRAHDWLAAARSRVGADWIVTAHHHDDRVERSSRGARGSSAGPRGSRPELGGVVRPLPPFTHAG